MLLLNVLLADDYAVNRKVILWMLEQIGCKPMAVSDGPSAVREAARQAFDVILMDMQMPGMDGVTATAEIRIEEERMGRPRVPILGIMTDYTDMERMRSLENGMDGHILRPVSRQGLLNALSEWLPSPLREPVVARPIDLRILSERCQHDVAFVREVLGSFLRVVPPILETMRSSLDRAEFGKLVDQAHGLRGSALTVAACPLANLCQTMENEAKIEDSLKCREALGGLVNEWDRLIPALNLAMKPETEILR